MLILLMTLLLSGGSQGFIVEVQGAKEDIKTVMENTDERKAALSTIKKLEKLTKGRDKELKKIRKQLQAAVAEHDYQEKNLDQLWIDNTELRDRFFSELLTLRFELKENIDRNEWADIFQNTKQ